MCDKNQSIPKPREKGVALIIILASLVIVSIVIVTFLTQTNISRQIAFSSSGQYRANQIATIGMDTVLGDLKSEIAAGSNLMGGAGETKIYIPTSRATAVPARVADDNFPNILKKSHRGTAFWPAGSSYSSTFVRPIRAIDESTLNAAVNGREITALRWNVPLLLPADFEADFTAPDWILVTREGAISDSSTLPIPSLLADSSATNPDYVIGRFAYIIYNQGGLLDARLVGYPTGVSTDFSSRRGLIGQVDLSRIPGIRDANSLIQWRNPVTAQSAADYEAAIRNNANGFSLKSPGDQTFISRQDFIRYVMEHPENIEPEALQYLNTFSAEVNAPSFTPESGRPRTQSGEGYRSVTATDLDDQFNPSLIATRVSQSFTRDSDGSVAVVGEPLIKFRFPLSRLSWLTATGPASGATSASIFSSFGLTWDSGSSAWIYRNGASSISRLSEVAAEGREPDFFELLQAGITIGSLGKTAGDGNSVTSPMDTNTYYQIMQVGANLIDQYDSDSFPTRIRFGSETFSGIENLPYLVRVVEMAYRPEDAAEASGFSENIGLWYQAEVWNPHSQAATPGGGPANFRYRATGQGRAFAGGGGGGTAPATMGASYDLAITSPGILFAPTIANSFLSEPTLLTQSAGATASGAEDTVVTTSGTHIGLHVGYVTARDRWLHNDPTSYYFTSAHVQPDPYITHELQYQSPSGWVTYDRIRNVAGGATVVDLDFFRTPRRATFMIRSDPRTDRFGVAASADGPPIEPNTPLHQTVRPDAGSGFLAWNWGAPAGWQLTTYNGSVPAIHPGLLADNKHADTLYNDPDGRLRMADGAYTSGTLPDGYPLAAGNISSRPHILNRPFRTVAEMGYASRDTAWKHLDFFTMNSGDGALLDLFSINEHGGTLLGSGKVDPNTRQVPVLEAVFAGAIQTEEANGVISDTDATTLANSVLALTTGTAANEGPIRDKSELVARWAGDPSVLPAIDAETIIKRRREAGVRVLSDLANTRTWNLLIDVIAQSGRYSKVGHRFVVEGERRYWLHVAIDRYTGQVVAQHLEPVNE